MLIKGAGRASPLPTTSRGIGAKRLAIMARRRAGIGHRLRGVGLAHRWLCTAKLNFGELG